MNFLLVIPTFLDKKYHNFWTNLNIDVLLSFLEKGSEFFYIFDYDDEYALCTVAFHKLERNNSLLHKNWKNLDIDEMFL